MRICSNLKYQSLWVCYKSYVLQRGKCNIYVSFTFLLVLKSNQIYTNKLIRVLREKICFFRISCFLQLKTFSFITIKNFVILLRFCLHIEFIIHRTDNRKKSSPSLQFHKPDILPKTSLNQVKYVNRKLLNH